MHKGYVRWFDPEQGHGYIDPEEGGPAVFVHRDALAPELGGVLEEAQHVAYEIEATPSGEVARWIRPATAAET